MRDTEVHYSYTSNYQTGLSTRHERMKEKPKTIEELFGKKVEITPNKVKNNSKQNLNKNNKQNIKANKSNQNIKKVQPAKQKEFIEPKNRPLHGLVDIGIVKFTSDGKEYKFLISDKLNINILKNILKEAKNKYLAVNVWSNPSKTKPKKKQLAFLYKVETINLDKIEENKKPTAYIYKICKNQDNKQIKTTDEMIKYYKERKKKYKGKVKNENTEK